MSDRSEWIAEAMRLARDYRCALAEHQRLSAEAALRAHLSTVPSAPDGWVVVPVEPTEAMLNAGDFRKHRDQYEPEADAYRAMIAAAPKQENFHKFAPPPRTSDMVYVCPIKDIVCGDISANWCAECPKKQENQA